jgi:N4-gp56 family major capsid protein
MATTFLNDLINPEIISDMIGAELERQLRATDFYRVDKTLVGRAGDSVTIPVWKYIGPAEDLAENDPVDITQMATDSQQFTIKKAAKAVELTDESVLSGYGDPVSETVRQLRMSIADKMDDDGISLLKGITTLNGHVLTLTSPAIMYDDILDALDMMEQYQEEQGINAYLLANHSTVKAIRKSPEFMEMPSQLRDQTIATGVVGSIAGASIVISNKLNGNEAYILTPQCLTAFLKRDVAVEQQRNIRQFNTLISASCHYTIAIEDYDRLVAIRWT